MFTSAQVKSAILSVDGRAAAGGVVELPPNARLLLDVIVQGGAGTGTTPTDAEVASLVNTPTSGTSAALSATYASKNVATRQKFGEHADPLGVTTSRVPVVFSTKSDNPSTGVEQHFLGYSFYTGTPGPGVGSLQGGSSEAVAFASPANMGTVVGFEGAGRANSDTSRTVDTVIGLIGTASAQGSVQVNNLVGFRAAGPLNDLGVGGAVVNAFALQALEPAVGTNRYAAHITGRTRLVKGAHANALEIVNGGVLQWASDGARIAGYASDGASERVILDPRDTATIRQSMTWFNGATKGIVLNDIGGTGTGNAFEFQRGGVAKFAVLSDGGIFLTQAVTTAAPAAGAAAAPPATPAEYMTISVNGVSRKVALY